MGKELHTETQKEYYEKCAITSTNKVLFDMVESHVDHLITRRLMEFALKTPPISEYYEKQKLGHHSKIISKKNLNNIIGLSIIIFFATIVSILILIKF